MIPSKGQHVKILLINNTLIEGIIEDWQSSQGRGGPPHRKTLP